MGATREPPSMGKEATVSFSLVSSSLKVSANRAVQYLVCLGLVVLFGCASRPCREPQSPQEKKAEQERIALEAQGITKPKTPEDEKTKLEKGRLFVAKNDGSKQCESNTGMTVELMEKQLKGIKVYSRSTKNDGLIRVQMCGASTGYYNVYEIDETSLVKAKGLGFIEWKQ